jgi:hypothetical protein
MVFRLHFSPNYLKCYENVDVSIVWEAGALMVNHESFIHLSQAVRPGQKPLIIQGVPKK